MPAKFTLQRNTAGAALIAKLAKMKSELQAASWGMPESMSEEEFDEAAATKRVGKPQ